MQPQLQTRLEQLENYVKQASASGLPEQIQSYLSRFGAVLICGYIERSVEIIVLDRLSNRAHPRVLNFLKSHFQRGANYDCAAVEQLLNRFDSNWHRRFRAFVEENEDVREGVSSCYSVRNSVAHGGTSSVGLARLRELLAISKKLVDAIVVATA